MILSKKQIYEKAKEIKLLILDVDGVMTDGRVVLDNHGNELKFFDVRDGHGIKMVQREGVAVALITGRQSEVVLRRARELGIAEVYQGAKKKLVAYDELRDRLGVKDFEVAYVGDDVVDLPVMVRVGLSVAVEDADNEVKKRALWVTQNPGGRGAVREVTDLIIKAKGRWDDIIASYTKI